MNLPPELPSRIDALPRTERGIPIPFFVAYVGGKPDLRFADRKKPHLCAKKRRCWVCGQALERTIAFVGGPISTGNARFADGPMHRECAEFSLKYCPFMATPNLQYSERRVPGDVVAPSGMPPTTDRPDRFGLTLCQGFNTQHVGEDEIHFLATLVQSVTYWRHGAPMAEK